MKKRKYYSKKISEIFDCSPSNAQHILSKNKAILQIEIQDFIRNASFCNKHFKLSEIIEQPILLSFNSSVLQHRYFSLHELGCSNINANHVLRFQEIMRKSQMCLQRQGIHIHYNNCIDEYVNFLSDSVSRSKDEIKNRLSEMYQNGSALKKIKEEMNAEYLGSKLNCSLYQARQIMNRHRSLKLQSIYETNHLLDLFYSLNFPASKICRVPSLLSIHHEIVKDFLTAVPTILGINTFALVDKLPVVLKKPVNVVLELESILKEFNISDEQLLCCPRVLTFDPRTLRERLEFLCDSENFRLLKSYKKFLWLTCYFNNLGPRLEALNASNIPFSIAMFIASEQKFAKYLDSSQHRTRHKDVCYYLALCFNCSEADILSKLQEYPNLHNSCLINCKRVVEFLLGAGISRKQLFHSLGVINYDIDVVEMYFNELPKRPELQPYSEWADHYNLLQLLIYTIEVDAGFKGSKLYRTKIKSADKKVAISNYSP